MKGSGRSPVFFTTIVGVLVFAYWLGWLPAFGAGKGFTDQIYHLILPATALALGMIYMGLARVLMGGRAVLLAETCLALGVIFTSLAIPLGLDARWTAAAWAVEGAGIFWLGLRQQRRVERRLREEFGVYLVRSGRITELRPGSADAVDASST
mgnify:CR=1 FL=1